MILNKSTAFTRVWLFPLSGRTIALKLSKAGAAAANPSAGASNLTELANGLYKFALTATDTDTPGALAYEFLDTLAIVSPDDGPDQVFSSDLDTIAAAIAAAGTPPSIRKIKKILSDSQNAQTKTLRG